jgi:DNA-binding response OmpR family regulator
VPSEAKAQHAVLVVESEVIVRLVIAEFLRECGFTVYEGANAEEARAILESDRPVDITLVDVQSEGFVLSQWIREHRPGVDVILTSGKRKAAERAEELCDDGPLQKPYQPLEVPKRINFLLERRQSANKP